MRKRIISLLLAVVLVFSVIPVSALAAVRDLLGNDPAVNQAILDEVGYVDGTPIALGDLKTIVEIEQELARIQETYFSNRTFSGEAVENLNSLLDQMETSGISLQSDAAALASTGSSVAVVDVSNLKRILRNTSAYECSETSGSFNLKKGQTISFDVHYIQGTMLESVKGYTVSLNMNNNAQTLDQT